MTQDFVLPVPRVWQLALLRVQDGKEDDILLSIAWPFKKSSDEVALR